MEENGEQVNVDELAVAQPAEPEIPELEPIEEEELDLNLSPEQADERRLARRPNIEHLQDGVARLTDGRVIALFDVGDRIVVDRMLLWDPKKWLDTRVYEVREIDDDTGLIRAWDVVAEHNSFLSFTHPTSTVKLAPARGNPFRAPPGWQRAQNIHPVEDKETIQTDAPIIPVSTVEQPVKRGRGRPKGSKNRPKDEIQADKARLLAERRAKREAREKRRRG